MRLGLIGLGRIGAFHADTLSHLDGVDSLVVTDAVPAVTASVAERFGAEAADSPEALIASGVDGIVIAAATDAHTDADPGRRRRRHPGVLREAALRRRRARPSPSPTTSTPAGCRSRSATPAGSTRPTSRPATPWPTASSAGCTPCGRPPWTRRRRRAAYIAVSGGIFRDCSVHDFDTVRWVTGREVVEVYATGSARGDDFFAELGDVATAADPAHLRRRRHRGGVQHPLQPARARRPPGAARHRRQRRRRLDRQHAAPQPRARHRRCPAGKPWTFFMDRLADAFRAELTAFTEVVAGRRPSPCTVDDALAVTWIAEAATLSLQQHRPVQIDEVQQ